MAVGRALHRGASAAHRRAGELDPETIVTPGISCTGGRGGMKRYTRDEMAARVPATFSEGAYVNLGIGLPTLVRTICRRSEIILHTRERAARHGARRPRRASEDPDLINAGKQPVTMLPGLPSSTTRIRSR
jgi:hypothetical protein